MDQDFFEQFVDPQSFVPFVITTVDGFAVPVPDLGHIITGRNLAVVKIAGGILIHIPWRRIAHVTHKGELG